MILLKTSKVRRADLRGDRVAHARSVACAFKRSSSARLDLAARRVDPDVGPGLAAALCDMFQDADIPPAVWPVEDMLDLLARDAAPACLQRDRLVADLARIRDLAQAAEDDAEPSDVAA